MTLPDLVLYDEEFRKIKDSLHRLASDANANVVFLVDKNGQQIAAVGDLQSLDTTSLASLTAGNVAATDGLAKLIGEREFSVLFHEGQRDHIHISIVAKRAILLVIFDERSSLGLVRLRVKRSSQEMEQTFEEMMFGFMSVIDPSEDVTTPSSSSEDDVDEDFSGRASF